MSEEKKISRKTLKIILGVCIGAMAALTVGFFCLYPYRRYEHAGA